MNFFERYLFNRIKVINKLEFDGNIEGLEKKVRESRNQILDFLKENRGNNNIDELAKNFTSYTVALEELILFRRIESGISTLIYFIYTLLGNIAGIVMSILVFISTTGYIGHLILIVSIMGGIAGIVIALISMKREREFISSLKNGI